MGYSWFRVDGSFAQHPKTLALCAALNEPLADAYVIRLWSWVHCYAPTGVIPSRVTAQLEAALRWRGTPDLLLQTMTEVGFLEPVSDGLLVHDWPDYQAVFAQKAKKDAAKKRQRRRRGHAAVTHPVTPPSRVTAPPTRRDETRRDDTSLVLVDVEPTPPALEVFEHWRKATGKARAVLDKKRRGLIDRRLAEGNQVEDLKAAIDGYVKSPWHQGANDRKRKFLALELMLRDAEHIEAGLDLLMAAGVVAPKSREVTVDPYADPESANG